MSAKQNTDAYYTFDDDRQAIDIHRYDLPQPWINYLSNGDMHAFISQAGGGFAWWKSASELRLTRYRAYHAPIDSPGPYVYIREQDGTVWSPSIRPVETPLDSWVCSHLPGRTVFTAKRGDIEAQLEFFIAPDHNVLVWDLTLLNSGSKDIEVDVFAFAEYDQHDAINAMSWGYYQRHMLSSWFCEDTQAVKYLYRNFYIPIARKHPMVYMAGTRPLASYSGDRDDFFGNYRSERRPAGVENNHCGNKVVSCGEACGALHNKITIPAGSKEHLNFFLGAATGAMEDFEAGQALAKRDLDALRKEGAVEQQRIKLQQWWADHFSTYHAQLPDELIARHVNIWTPVNTVHTGRYSRSVNNLAPGIRGVGFRDTCQDMMSIAYRKPDWAIENMRYLMSQQFEDGHAVHTAFPVEGKKPSTSLHSDDHLWLPLLAYAILSETGDLSLLEEKVPYLAEDAQSPAAEATIWEHLLACVRFTESHLGQHDIPLTLASDWNDIIGRFAKKGKGESTFAGMQYIVALRQLIEIAHSHNDAQAASWLQDCLNRQELALNACAWDGKWWRRGFDDDGNPVGTQGADFGNLFLNPQSWAVLAGIGTREQRLEGMDEVSKQLDTGIGLKILTPGFKTYPEVHDPFSGYGPGTGENGAIFCHANTWAIIAEAMLGRATQAWKYYTQLIPENVTRNVGIDTYQAEPYAWVSNIVGPENPRFGWGNVTQVTGTATWMDVAATQYLLGVRAVLGGLRIDPCIPSAWKRYTVERVFNGCKVTINVENPNGHEHGLAVLEVDGENIDLGLGPIIPRKQLAGKQEVKVRAVLG